MTAGLPTEPPILTAEQVAEMLALLTYPNTPHWVNARRVCDSHEALRARLRDAEETLRYYARIEGHPVSGAKGWDSGQIARAYFERHADPQEKP